MPTQPTYRRRRGILADIPREAHALLGPVLSPDVIDGVGAPVPRNFLDERALMGIPVDACHAQD
eukprot:398265-Alexandrium_andersonii.AAC.1